MPATAWAIQLAATVVLLENFVPMASLSVSMARTAVWRLAGRRGPMSSREIRGSARSRRSGPRAGGLDGGAGQDQGGAGAGSARPPVQAPAATPGDRQQERGKAGLEGHELHPTEAVRCRQDSAGGRRPQGPGGIGEVRGEEPA